VVWALAKVRRIMACPYSCTRFELGQLERLIRHDHENGQALLHKLWFWCFEDSQP
jgi:hypothetical protein